MSPKGMTLLVLSSNSDPNNNIDKVAKLYAENGLVSKMIQLNKNGTLTEIDETTRESKDITSSGNMIEWKFDEMKFEFNPDSWEVRKK